jgi:hypothetical protein
MVLAIAPITDITTWLRGSGLEIVLICTGAVLVSRDPVQHGTRPRRAASPVVARGVQRHDRQRPGREPPQPRPRGAVLRRFLMS